MQLTGEAEAARRQAIGLAEAKATEALGLARATGFEAQKDALGGPATALVAVANAVADGHITVVPEVLVTGGGGGSLDGLAATLMRYLGAGSSSGSANGKANAKAPDKGLDRGPDKDAPPSELPAVDGPVEVPTDVEAAALTERESLPDGSAGGAVTP